MALWSGQRKDLSRMAQSKSSSCSLQPSKSCVTVQGLAKQVLCLNHLKSLLVRAFEIRSPMMIVSSNLEFSSGNGDDHSFTAQILRSYCEAGSRGGLEHQDHQELCWEGRFAINSLHIQLIHSKLSKF